MNRRICRPAVTIATTVAWATLLVDGILDDATLQLSDGASMLAGCAAVSGSLIIAGWRRSRPVAEVYDMAYEAGRRHAQIEGAVSRSTDSVVVQFRSRA